MATPDAILPLTLYGPEVSYFTGKLEAVLRYKELPHERVSIAPTELERDTGVAQVPALRLADGRWLTDSTPIIAWLEEQFPEPVVVPRDPVLAFFSHLLEDYADEWLWRPAMHYRWDYEVDAQHLSRTLVSEAAGHVPLPGFVLRSLVRSRQRSLFTKGDGVTPENWDHVERIYFDSLKQLEAIFQVRPYLLGDAAEPRGLRIHRTDVPALRDGPDARNPDARDGAGGLRVGGPGLERPCQRDRRRAAHRGARRLEPDPGRGRLRLSPVPLCQRGSLEGRAGPTSTSRSRGPRIATSAPRPIGSGA